MKIYHTVLAAVAAYSLPALVGALPLTHPPEQPATVACTVTSTEPVGKPGMVMIQCPNRPVADFIELLPNQHVTEGDDIHVVP